MATATTSVPARDPAVPWVLPPWMRLAQTMYGLVAGVLALALLVPLLRAPDLAAVLFILALVAYPAGFAVGIARMRVAWAAERPRWGHALPWLVHALAGLWGALAILTFAAARDVPSGLRTVLDLGLSVAHVAFLAGWVFVLAYAPRAEGKAFLLRVSILLPLAFYAALAAGMDPGAG
jgi:hypothetical protein